MKIAYVVPYVPNLIRTRPYNLLLQLADAGHEVDLFTVGSGRQDEADARALGSRLRAVHYHVLPLWRSLGNSAAAVPSRKPLQTVYSWHEGLARELSVRVRGREYDVVHVEHLRGSRYGTYIKSKHPRMPVVWDSVDCISHLFQQAAGRSRSLFGRTATRFDLGRTRREEGRLLSCFDEVLVTSPSDRDALLELAPGDKRSSPVSVLPNGVDLDYFHPNPGVERSPAALVFSGKMSYHANISMAKYLAEEIMPKVWAARPGTCLYIVGKDPPADIRNLASNPWITVTGTVEDIRPYLWKATASIVPLLYGAGIQNKILEAMATATPVIASTRTLSALQVEPGRDLLAAEEAEGFACEILRLLDDERLQKSLGEAGLAYVCRHHDWTAIASRLAEIYQRARDGSRGR